MRMLLAALAAITMAFAATPAAAQDILTITYDGTVTGTTSTGGPFSGITNFTGTADLADTTDGNFAFSLFTALFDGTTYTVPNATGLIMGDSLIILTNGGLFAPISFNGQNFSVGTPFAVGLGTGGTNAISPLGNVLITGGTGIVNSSVTAAVPEPATWAMMLMGFGAMGVALRRRRKTGTIAQLA